MGTASSLSPTPYPLRVIRCLRLTLHLLWAALATALLYRFLPLQGRLAFKQRWSRKLLRILGITLDAGMTGAPPGCLIVANHISWLDIFAINALRPASFIAKAEIRGWPFVGWLSAGNDTVFLVRGSRQHALQINGEIDARLNAGCDVVIFPEGRTTDGTRVLEFHGALLQPAIETGRPVLPVAISYHDERGRRSVAPSFADAVTLPQCFAAILASRSLTARLVPLPTIATTRLSRRDVSQAARKAITASLGFPQPNREPETPPGPPA